METVGIFVESQYEHLRQTNNFKKNGVWWIYEAKKYNTIQSTFKMSRK